MAVAAGQFDPLAARVAMELPGGETEMTFTLGIFIIIC